MSAITIQRLSLFSFLVSFIKSFFRRISLIGHTPRIRDTPQLAQSQNVSTEKTKAVRTMRYIVMHSYRAKRERKKRRKSSKRLSYVSSAILEDYGQIIPRRERRLLAKQGIPFRPIYN